MNIFDLWYSKVKIRNIEKIKLLEYYKTPEKIWNSINCNKSSNDRISKALKEAWNKEYLLELLEFIKKKEIKTVIYGTKEYPQKLLDIDDSPYLLYYYGEISELNKLKGIGIVGARQCSNYGIDAAKYIARALSVKGINIISGMARGIDTIAHTMAVEKEGFTTAILGCGIDIIYPAINKDLYHKICNKGCVISEYLPGTPPLAYNFPIRNRIISGLCEGMVVIEADEKSGSLISAHLALNQGKDIIAVPGSIFSDKSRGTNKLIKDGAYPFTNSEEMYYLFNIKAEENGLLEGVIKKALKNNKNISKIYGILTDTPMHIDDILKVTNIDITVLYELLLEMQLQNTIKCICGSYYVKVNSMG